MSWALRRQIFYVLVVIVFFLGLGFLIVYPTLNKPPTCMDRKQNGTETGVDCGGSCVRACNQEVNSISTLWARTFQVLPERYNAIAYLENKNENLAVYKIKYRFRFGDKDNLYIGKREGETYIPPSGKFAIFEPAIDVGKSIPVYTTLEFTEVPTWVKVDPVKVTKLKIYSSDIKLENESTSPKLSATLRNDSLTEIKDIDVVAILYNTKGNAISVSSTYLDRLKGEESAPVNFTWPEPLKETVVTKEILPLFNIFTVDMK